MGPGDGGAALAHQFVQVDPWHQGVIDDHQDSAGGDQAAGEEPEIVLVAAEPVAAVDEDMNGRALGVSGQIHIQCFLGPGPIGNVEPGVEFGQHRLALGFPTAMKFNVFGHPGPVVVLGVQRGLAVVPIDGGIVHGAVIPW